MAAFAIALVIVSMVCAASQAGAQALNVYSTQDDDDINEVPPAAGGRGWERAGETGGVRVDNGDFWVAFRNADFDVRMQKWLRVRITTPAGRAAPALKGALGFRDTRHRREEDRVEPKMTSKTERNPDGSSTTTYWIVFPECPVWERIHFRNPNGGGATTYTVTAESWCATRKPDGFDKLFLEHGHFGAHGAMLRDFHITELAIFPAYAHFDQNWTPLFNAPKQTGPWQYSAELLDPLGAWHHHWGVHFRSNGSGLTIDDIFDLRIQTIGQNFGVFHVFAYDADSGEWSDFLLDSNAEWADSFDMPHLYEAGEGVQGVRGWKGWDNDPAFDAIVTPANPLSPPHSLEVQGAADVVREFDEVTCGRWSLSAMQYIPSDFTSGGKGQFRGSHFLILSRYQDGGPYRWSVDLQVDSDRGAIRIYHGHGNNTIDIPYQTDRWVKIEALIDLDEDWVSIYYDDQFIVQYPWTGGIHGDGSGDRRIAALDLFSNESSTLFYDDVRLFVGSKTSADPTMHTLFPVRGRSAEGDFERIRSSDDLHWLWQPDVLASTVTPPIDLQFEGATLCDGGTAIRFVLEDFATEAGVVLRLSLFNFETGQFEGVIFNNLPTADTLHMIERTNTVGSYIGPNGELIGRGAYTRPQGVPPFWMIGIDQARFEIDM